MPIQDPCAPARPSRELPVLRARQRSGASKWRATVLVILSLLMVFHFIQWKITGTTISPIEPSETMYTFSSGAINAGFIFFALAILSTLIFGRWVCGWGCHIVALQDLCAWLLRKLGLTPKPFRSRLLIYVPIIAAAYMFLWPIALRILARPAGEPLIPQFTNHIVTTEFWATFPTIAVAIPFLFICGFVTVYFLGSKGFCTYGCPYGGVFRLADNVASLRIRVTDACNQCGLCTDTCMANVRVHAEVARYGMVVDPGCMKHMDCISVCPNDALYLGFGRPAVGVPKELTKSYSMSWPEEILAANVFLASFFAVWDVYLLVPMLMALGIAAVTTFLVMHSVRLLRYPDVTFYRSVLRSNGTIRSAGWLFLAFAALWTLLNAHSGYIHYQEAVGIAAFQRVQIPDELALAQSDPSAWLSETDRKNIESGKAHLYRAFDGGLFINTAGLQSLSWLEYLSGNASQSVNLLRLAEKRQEGQTRALTEYYQGAMLNRMGQYQEALVPLDLALAERADLVKAHEERGAAMWKLGRKDDAIASWKTASSQNGVLAKYMLSSAMAMQGQNEEADANEAEARKLTPDDPYFHWMIGLRLQDLEMKELAEKHFQRAVQLDSTFILRRKPR
jgi:polyferredoxin/tetratricopeptide (TPR) repeat protein